jgi:hypothetical protein
MKRIEIELAPWVELPERENKPLSFTEWLEKDENVSFRASGFLTMSPEVLEKNFEEYFHYRTRLEEKPSEILKEVFFRDDDVWEVSFETWTFVEKVVYLGRCPDDGDLFLVQDAQHTTICQGALNDLFIYVNE